MLTAVVGAVRRSADVRSLLDRAPGAGLQRIFKHANQSTHTTFKDALHGLRAPGTTEMMPAAVSEATCML